MGNILKINPNRIQNNILDEVAKVIKSGGVILYPTDTIYGLGCDAFNTKAIKRIFLLKQRLKSNPMLVIARNRTMVDEMVENVSPLARKMMNEFWPGPLTMLFKGQKSLDPLLLSKKGTVGIRIPKNSFCLKLIKKCEKPIVSTSANISGLAVSNEIEELMNNFREKVDLIVDAGDLRSSLPSTVVDVSDNDLLIIREGVIPRRRFTKYLLN